MGSPSLLPIEKWWRRRPIKYYQKLVDLRWLSLLSEILLGKCETYPVFLLDFSSTLFLLYDYYYYYYFLKSMLIVD